MADEELSTGGFSHSRKPRWDGFYDTCHPETREKLLLTRVKGHESTVSLADWAGTFAIHKALGALRPTAWWPVEGQGVEGAVAFAVFTPWESTLKQDLAKGYQCKPAELAALAECLINGLDQLHATAQRPHGALRPECLVFPKLSVEKHDSLAPRLTGLVPLDETDPRDRGDRRRVGHLLYAAITGVETKPRVEAPDFGLAWSNVSLPRKNGWKKFIEELTNGSLDNESYGQIRLRIGKLQGGKLTIVGGLLIVMVCCVWYFNFKGPAGKGGEPKVVSQLSNPTNVGTTGINLTNPVTKLRTAEPAWLMALKADKKLFQDLGLSSEVSGSRLQSDIENWWKNLPKPQAEVWVRLNFPKPASLGFDEGTPDVLRDEVKRRLVYSQQSGELSTAQKDLAGEIDDWLGSLMWGQEEIEALIRSQVTMGASNVLKGKILNFGPEVNPLEEYPKALKGLTNAPQFYPANFKGWGEKGWSELSADQKSEAAGNLSDVWRNDLVAWANFEPPGLDGPEKQAKDLRNRANEAKVDTTTLDSFLREANTQYAALVLKSRLRHYQNREEAQKALDDVVRKPLNDAANALKEAEKRIGYEKARNARIARENKLQELDKLDKNMAQTATKDSQTSGGVRKARAELRKLLDVARARDDAKEVSFTFPVAESFYQESEDKAWVEEAKASVDFKSIDSLVAIRSALELKLLDKPSGFAESRTLAIELKKLADKLAEDVINQAKASDADRALRASKTAQKDVAKALQTLEEQLKSFPGTVTNQSIQLREELVKVHNWLNLPQFRFTESGWSPTNQPAAGAGWDSKYPEVAARIKEFQDSIEQWKEADKRIPEVHQFKDAAEFNELNILFRRPLLSGKARFIDAWTSLQGYHPLIQEGESLKASKDANLLSDYIAKVKDQRPPYFKTLASALQTQLSEVRKKAQEDAQRKAKSLEFEALKAKFVTAAKGVGGITFSGTKYTATRGVGKNVARNWMTELEANRSKYLALSSELDTTADKSQIERELEGLKKALQSNIDFGD